MRLLDIVPVEEYVTVHTSVCQEAMKFVVRWDGTLRGSGVTLHLFRTCAMPIGLRLAYRRMATYTNINESRIR